MIISQLNRQYMITKVKQSFISLIYKALSNDSFSKMSKPRKNFIAHTFLLFSGINGSTGGH
jgi:hypothetical protein